MNRILKVRGMQYTVILIEIQGEGVFADKCDVTVGLSFEDGSGSDPANNGTDSCEPQDQEFQRIFQIGYSLGMILSFPLGLCLDRFGEVPTRLGAGFIYTLGKQTRKK